MGSPAGPVSGAWPRHGTTPLTGMTEREREVLNLIERALSNDEITTRLQLSMGTVETHIRRPCPNWPPATAPSW
ncbi:helix-turn-helix transcriptional regulator [Streptomyces roseolus]|uniref:helix-turn-helix transcriptional regulator n=2 Tax=Streptomyces roseolus TaxID=67358 RepID=UPI00378948AE